MKKTANRHSARFLALATKAARRASLAARVGMNRILSVFGHEDYVRFIVLTRSRTGSNLLVSFLNGHPDIFAEGEIFARMHGRDPIARLNSAFGRQPRHIKAKGFKIFYYHPLDADGNALWSRLESMKDLRIVHLTRRNVLRTLLSRKIAGLQDSWTATKYDRVGVENRRVEFTVEELETGFKQTRQWEETAGARFGMHQTIRVAYEDLVEDPRGNQERVLAFLGMRKHALQTNLRRQNPENLRELIANYDALKRAFAGTRWESFFDD